MVPRLLLTPLLAEGSMKPACTIFSQPVAREVLVYFITYPDANDTVEGIVEWRLLEQQIRHSVAEAEATLSGLVAKKLMLARRGTDGRIHYRVNPAKKTEILKLLNLTAPQRRKTRNRPPTENSKS